MPLGLIGILDLHRRLEVVSIRHQRVIGIEFVLNSGFFVDLLDAQHFLDLVTNQQFVFEQEQYMVAKKNTA